MNKIKRDKLVTLGNVIMTVFQGGENIQLTQQNQSTMDKEMGKSPKRARSETQIDDEGLKRGSKFKESRPKRSSERKWQRQ